MHPALRDLTPRELQVLRCIAEGYSTKETALNLGISFKTAACHRHRIMQKIGVHGTGALVRFAIANGVVTLSQS
jgi:DNA-binding CsgD family transcriptional regulator